MKKKVLRFIAAFIIVAAFVPACDLLENCGTCEFITQYSDGDTDTTLTWVYCDEAYEEKLNSTPVVIGEGTSSEITTFWSCY